MSPTAVHLLQLFNTAAAFAILVLTVLTELRRLKVEQRARLRENNLRIAINWLRIAMMANIEGARQEALQSVFDALSSKDGIE